MGKIREIARDVMSYQKNIAQLPCMIEELSGEIVEAEARWRVAEVNGEKETVDKALYWQEGARKIKDKAIKVLEKVPSKKSWNLRFLCEAKETLELIKLKLEEVENFQWVPISSDVKEPSELIYCSYNTYSKNIKSMEKKLQDVLGALESGNGHTVVGIFGLPGVGKTALVDELAWRCRVCHSSFDLVVKVDISQPEGFERMRDQVWKINLQKLQYDVLMILDGVSYSFDLTDVGIYRNIKGRHRWKIVLVSRSEDVCQAMSTDENFAVDCLNLVEAKILFRETLGDGIRNLEYKSKKYKHVENDFLAVCKGLPSAIIRLAHILKTMTSSGWQHHASQLKSETYSMAEFEEVNQIMQRTITFAYDVMESDEMKLLWLLCCLSREVYIGDLMRYGFGLGLFHDALSMDDAICRANLWANRLISLSLLESKEPGLVRMHDNVRQAAIVASQGDYSFGFEDTGNADVSTLYWKYPACVMSDDDDDNNSFIPGELDRLLIFEFECRELLSDLPDNYFRGMLAPIRVLNLSRLRCRILPSSIDCLKSLVTLYLECCQIADISAITKLVNLQILVLRGSNGISLPPNIGDLEYLRLLDLTACYLASFPFDEIARLKHLEVLYMLGCIVEGSHPRFAMKKLQHLRELQIDIPNYLLEDYGDFSFNSLSKFSILIGHVNPVQSLHDWRSLTLSHLMLSMSRELRLEETDACQFRKKGLRSWLKKAEVLRMDNVRDIKEIAYDLDEDGFQCLRSLVINDCDGMRFLINTKGTQGQFDVFPQLEYLSLHLLKNLRGICNGRVPSNLFIELRSLIVTKVNKLKSHVLPISQVPKLREVEIRACQSLQYVFSSSTDSQMIQGSDNETHEMRYLKKIVLQRLERLKCFCSQVTDDLHCWILFNRKVKLPALEELWLVQVKRIKELWDFSSSEESTATATTFSKLKILVLYMMPSLRHVWSEKLCYGNESFGNLKHLKIDGCNRLKGIFPCTVPAALLQLETLDITSCTGLEEVIISEINAGISVIADTITFLKLRWLRLGNLSSFLFFYRGKSIVRFPALKAITLRALPKMAAFIGSTNNQEPGTSTIDATNEIGLNSMIYPSLETVNIIDCPSMRSFVSAALYTPVLSFLRVDEIRSPLEVDDLNELNKLLSEVGRHIEHLYKGDEEQVPVAEGVEEYHIIAEAEEKLQKAKPISAEFQESMDARHVRIHNFLVAPKVKSKGEAKANWG